MGKTVLHDFPLSLRFHFYPAQQAISCHYHIITLSSILSGMYYFFTNECFQLLLLFYFKPSVLLAISNSILIIIGWLTLMQHKSGL